jgi:peptidoglycan/LPS O-acetylase OafA/YrhL
MSLKYRPEIDGLRALAVIPVILFHAGVKYFNGGYIGVDIFFVISGYLISSIIKRDLELDRFSILTFYERRARRILPALSAVLITTTLFGWFFFDPKYYLDYFKSLFSVSVFSSNIWFWRSSDYFSMNAELKPLLHTWSLSVEEQYYIFFPLIMMFLWRFGLKFIQIILIGIFFLSFGAGLYDAQVDTNRGFYLLHTRTWELLIGVFIAFNEKKIKHFFRIIPNQYLSLFGFTLICFSIFYYNKWTPFPSYNALIPTVGTALLIMFCTRETIIFRLLTIRAVVLVGLISYSAYLWHQPVFAVIRYFYGLGVSKYILITAGAGSLFIAYLSWRFIEAPFRSTVTFGRKSIFSLSLVTLFSFISIGLFGYYEKGFDSRLNKFDKKLLKSAISSPMRKKCHSRDLKDSCVYNSGEREIVTFGDSHTVELSYSISKLLKSRKIKVLHLSRSACIPLIISDKNNPFNYLENCSDWLSEGIEYIKSNKIISDVVISFRMPYHLFGDQLETYPLLPNKKSLEEKKRIWDSYIKLLKSIKSSNKKIHLVLSPPELPRMPSHLLFTGDALDNKNYIGVSKSWFDSRNKFIYSRLKDFDEIVDFVYDPSRTFCDSEYCYLNDGVNSYYFDDDHMSLYGADIISKSIVKNIN